MRGDEVLARAPRSAARARARVAPATSSSRSPQSGALFMGMRADDRAEHRYRSQSQLYMSSSSPRWMRGGEVLARVPGSAARARDGVAPATSSSRSPPSGALSMSMCANDRTEHRYRSRSQRYTSSSSPRMMCGDEVLARAWRSAARARDRVAPATSASRSPRSGALPMSFADGHVSR